MQELADTNKRIQNRDKEMNLIQSVFSEIESSSIEQIIARSQRAISNLAGSKSLEKVNSDLELAYDKIEDAKSMLNQVLQEFHSSHYSPEEIEDRLYEIRTLARKHSCSSDELIDFLERSEEQLCHIKMG